MEQEVKRICGLIIGYKCAGGKRWNNCCYDCSKINTCKERCLNTPDKCKEYKECKIVRPSTTRAHKLSLEERMKMVEERRRGMPYAEIGQNHGVHKTTARQWVRELDESL